MDSDVSVFYRVPSEDNTGAVHALEHCVFDDVSFEPEDDRDYMPEAYTIPVGVFFRVSNALKDVGCCSNDFAKMINGLKSPRFLSDESIFKKEVFDKANSLDGKPLASGRLFIEIEQRNRFNCSAQASAIFENLIMNIFSILPVLFFLILPYGG